MEPTTISNAANVPEWVTAVGSVLVFLVTFGFASYGWIKARFPTEVKGKPAGGDAVVLSAAIADSASINRLASAIEGMIASDNLNRIELQLIEKRLQLIHGEVRSVNEALEEAAKERENG
ncbi:MAG: hypothetical protein CMQ11_07145 [Gammaproteobacteria bacterium]|nr:hypothetical protein [Gammaproteobacteria bacterium]|tara:strand:- start:450 stop:809 length:360 start_codon:yes stop_codon:yes gene_type:complete